MNLPPALLYLKIDAPGRRPIHLWLPLFVALGVLSLVFTVIADVVLLLLGRRYHHYSVLLVRSLGALCDLRGMVLRFNDGKTAVDMTVK
jgi:hypothetical protein